MTSTTKSKKKKKKHNSDDQQEAMEVEETVESEESVENFLPEYSTLEDYSKALFGVIVKATKCSNALPDEGDEFDYYSSYPGFKTFSSRLGSRVNKMIGKLLHYEQMPGSWPAVDRDAVASSEAIEEQFDALVESNDLILETVSTLLDKAAGVSKNDKPVLPESSSMSSSVATWNKMGSSSTSLSMLRNRNIPRSQGRFKDLIDNSSTPFVPLIRHKPNALKPLPDALQQLQAPSSLQALISNAKHWSSLPERFAHPYQYEIEQLEPTAEQLKLTEPKVYSSLEESPSLIFVNTEEQLQDLLSDLKKVTEIAIDLEAHSYRSFQGFVCLMQVSTRSQDYIVDTLELRHLMYILNEVFTDPRIVKVLHGADWDICWLQRDFGLYVVNLFDTGQASRVLGLPRYSLAFLLDYCCKVKANKEYQLADWRVRPLPEDMVKYAREDTHYLLYVYDRMRNELIRRGNKQLNLLHNVLNRSKDICLKKYEKQIFREDSYRKLYLKHKRPLNPQQLLCLKLLYTWRDHTARKEDESPGFVLPNHMLFQIAEIMPREAQGVIACCTPVPILLRQQLTEVHQLVMSAREAPPSTLNELVSQSSAPPSSAPTTVTESMDTVDGPTPKPSASISSGGDVAITGPPVEVADPSITVFKTTKKKHEAIPIEIREKLRDTQRAFQQLLSMYLVAVPITSEELIRRSVVTVYHSLQSVLSATPASTPQQSPAVQMESVEGVKLGSIDTPGLSEGRQKAKRKLSAREMGRKDEINRSADVPDTPPESTIEEDLESGRVSKKKMKKTRSYSDGFQPYDYSSADYSVNQDYPVTESFKPQHSEGFGGGKKASQRSKVNMRSSHKSHTYSKPAKKNTYVKKGTAHSHN